MRQLTAVAIAVALLTSSALARQRPAWQDAVVQAQDLHAQGKILDAIAVLRKSRATLPPMHLLQLAQYLTEHVMASPKMLRPEAQKLLDEARGIADELVKRKQEVRSALMLKSMVLKVQADQVEQNPQRQQALKAESNRAWEDARAVNADGSPVVKSLDDLWHDAQVSAFTTGPDGKDREDVAVYEKFLAAHRDHVPALTAIARYYYTAANQITDKSPKSLATRTKYLETASSHYRRASEVATTEADAALAIAGLIDTLGPDFLNRPAEAATLSRAAVKKYPNQPMLVMQLVTSMLPTPAAADAAALRAAREAVPNNADAWHTFGIYLWSLDNRHRATQSRESTRMLLAEAASALDTAIKLKPGFAEAVIYKSVVLRTQAERVEQDPARRKALLAEADRLRDLGAKLQKR